MTGQLESPLGRLNPSGMPELWFSSPLDSPQTWTLRQGGYVVGILSATSLEVFGEAWDRRFVTGASGWRAEFTRVGTGETLTYRPRLLGGGDVRSWTGDRYRLRSGFFRGGWMLRSDRHGDVARIDRLDPASATRVHLGAAAATDPRVATLLLITCVAMIWDTFRARGGDAGGGG
jgi:hypothetical protein